MTAKKKDKESKGDVLDAPLQSEEARAKVLASSTGGSGTATGQAKEHDSGKEAERIEDLDSRGSEIPIAGGDPKPDGVEPGQPPVGAQAEPSQFATNGSIPVNMVASGSGLVPVSSVTSDPEQAKKLVEANLKTAEEHTLRSGFKKLPRSLIETMSSAELRAVASDRGYDIGDGGGSRNARRKFIQAQQADEGREDPEGGVEDVEGLEPVSDAPKTD